MDVENWLESGLADRVRSYFSNLVVQQLGISFTTLTEVVDSSKKCSTVDCVRKSQDLRESLYMF